MVDPLEQDIEAFRKDGRRRFELDDTGFNEVPKKYRKFYRKWTGPGDRVYCMPCMSRLVVVVGQEGRLEATVAY